MTPFFICEASHQNVFTIKSFLRFFELVSGLRDKFHKSKLTSIGVEREAIDTYDKTLNCDQMSIPFKYLGMHDEGNPKKKHLWKPILEKIKGKLNAWKGRYLTMARKVCLIKLIFNVLPLYYL